MATFLWSLLTGLAIFVVSILSLHALSYLTTGGMSRTSTTPIPHANGTPAKSTRSKTQPAPQIVKSEPFSFYAGCLTYLLFIIVCATYGALASIALRVVGLGGLSQWTTARSFKWTLGPATGVWFEILNTKGGKEGDEGEEWLNSTRPAVFVGNHQSEMDILMLATIFPKYCSVTSKRSLMWYPFLGWFMALSKTVFIDRSNRKSAIAAFDGAAATMHNHRQSVFIFPEGTRSYADHAMMLPFKKGAFHLAVKAQVPIVPVAVATYANVFNLKRKIYRPGTVPIRVLRPIPTEGLGEADVPMLVEKVREAMLKEIEDLTRLGEKWNGRVERQIEVSEEKVETVSAVSSGVKVR